MPVPLNARGTMTPLRRGLALGAAIAAVAAAGCGSEGDEPEPQPPSDQAAPPAADLARPMLAECGTGGFQKPRSERYIEQGEPAGWRVSYLAKQGSYGPGATTNVLLIQQSPELPRGGIDGGDEVTVGDHDVSLRTITEPVSRHAAQWRTAKARYIAIADGSSPTRLERLIECLP